MMLRPSFSQLALLASLCGGLAACSAPAGTTTDGSGQDTSGSGSGELDVSGGNIGTLPDETPASVDEDNPDCDAVLTLTIRDFTSDHPDFESYQGLNDIGCGMVAPDIGADYKPVFVSGIGTQKRVVSDDWSNLQFLGCDEWNGWTPTDVITSAATFNQWYNDIDGVNQSFQVDIPLADDGTGNYFYDSSAFFPIDGQGFGDTPGQSHNFSFTTEAHLEFGYVAGQKFTFRGDDDLWIFVNGKLALDLGGTHMPIEATLDFDAQAATLGIRPGQTYRMDIFHAERHTDQSNFRVTTNISCFKPVDIIR